MIPEYFWQTIATNMNILTIIIVLYFASKIFRNVMRGLRKPSYNTIEYQNCNIYPKETQNWK